MLPEPMHVEWELCYSDCARPTLLGIPDISVLRPPRVRGFDDVPPLRQCGGSFFR